MDKKHWISLHKAINVKNLKIDKMDSSKANKYFRYFVNAIHGDIGVVKEVMRL